MAAVVKVNGAPPTGTTTPPILRHECPERSVMVGRSVFVYVVPASKGLAGETTRRWPALVKATLKGVTTPALLAAATSFVVMAASVSSKSNVPVSHSDWRCAELDGLAVIS